MNIAIRADASLAIGTGHIMRCLTLAEELEKRYHKIFFICRNHTGNLVSEIEKKGFTVKIIKNKNKKKIHNNEYEEWLNDSWEDDAKETISATKNEEIDLLIVDHYALDENWEKEVKKHIKKIIAIDDLIERKHDCDILIDQNLGREGTEKLRSTKGSICLFGPKYAILRPEFKTKKSLTPINKKIDILITLGGIDIENHTEKILNHLKNYNLKITAIIGKNSPHLEAISNKHKNNKNIEIVPGTNEMAEYMMSSKICIGAAGSTSWERACLGLPTIMFAIAHNQINIAMELDKEGCAIYAGTPTAKTINDLINKINRISEETLDSMSKKAFNLVDGKGTERIINYIEKIQ